MNGINKDYAGNYIYESNQLQFLNTPEGYAEPIDVTNYNAGFRYTYQYKDHLGNIRLSYTDVNQNTGAISLSIVEENNYYPFGLEHKGYNNVVNGTEHPYKYNGKEHNEELGLNWYDYGARNYMPDLGRWTTVDPLAEKFYDNSPYHMAANNPIVFMDYNGKDYIITIDFDTGTVTVSGTLYATGGDVSAAQKAADNWNNQSGNFNYTFTDEDGNEQSLGVNYDINVQEVEVGEGQTKLGALNGALGKDSSGGANAFVVLSDEEFDENTNGSTQYNYIKVKESKKDDDTSTHEVGHALGVPHSEKGIMTAASSDPNRTSEINTTNVQDQVRNPIRGNTFDDRRGRATLQTTGSRVKPPATNRAQRRYRNGKVKKDE